MKIFISSTVKDFGPVRAELKKLLSQDGTEVLLSEDGDFPVEPGQTSHDACLAALRDCNVFVLLIGHRYGGEYLNQNKSITWREWDEAMSCGLSPIVLVRKTANERAQQAATLRRKILEDNPMMTVAECDSVIEEQDPFKTSSTQQRFAGVQRFIDTVRKGHIDNWCHLDWDGTAEDAAESIRGRIATMFRSYQRRVFAANDEVDEAHVQMSYFLNLLEASSVLQEEHADDESQQVLEHLVALVGGMRAHLFGFRTSEKHVLQIHLLDDGKLVPGARHASPGILKTDREWPVGKGHVGLAMAKESMLVSGDMRQSDALAPSDLAVEDDSTIYISAVTLPLTLGRNKRSGTLTLTSNRLDHFRLPEQLEVVIFQMVARIFEIASRMEDI